MTTPTLAELWESGDPTYANAVAQIRAERPARLRVGNAHGHRGLRICRDGFQPRAGQHQHNFPFDADGWHR